MRTTVAVAVLAVVAALLLVPFHPEAALLSALDRFTPHTAAQQGFNWFVVETGGNFLLFALVGAAAATLIRRPWAAAAAGVALSAIAELAQLVIPDRVASVSDFVVNSMGAITGAAAFWAVGVIRARSSTTRSRPSADV